MSPTDNDQMGQVPRMAPARDEIASFKRSQARGTLATSLGDVPNVEGRGSSLTGMKAILAAVVVLLLATSAAAAYLFQQMQKANTTLSHYELRVEELERKLSVTDESMSESSVAMKVKVQETDAEIRKLWDNVWKKSKLRFAEHESQLKSLQKAVKRSDTVIATTQKQLTDSNQAMAALTSQFQNVTKIELLVSANQQKLSQQETHLESASDKANRLGSNLAKMDQRLKSTEEWVESINGFRRQVNSDVGALKKRVGRVESGTTSVAP